MTYDPGRTRAYFDDFGDREWYRLEKTLQGRAKYAIHRRFLEEHVRPGMRVLDVGCGPGRFAMDIARMGARATLVDLSQVQLDFAHNHLSEGGALHNVDAFHRLDVLDLTPLEEAAFDLVVCFGGAISYTRQRHVDALRQLARVARPGSSILVSVMSLFGALRLLGPLDAAGFLETASEHVDWEAVLAGAGVVYTNPQSPEFHHPLALFTSDGLRAAIVEAGLEPGVIATASPFLPEFLQVPRIDESPRATAALIALELALCAQPGLRDAGGHMIAVARNPSR